MAVTGVVRASCVDILAAISAQLLAKNVVIDPSRIIVTVRPNVPHFAAEKDILLYPRGFNVIQDFVSAGGRVTTEVTRLITTICRTRLHLDEANRDKQWLLEPNLGHLIFEEATADALQLFWPVNKDGNLMLIEPMRLLRMDSLGKDAGDPAWGKSALDWEVKYMPPLDQTVQ